MGSKLFRNPQALSSALAALGTLQPRAFVFLNNLDPLDSASNYYLDYIDRCKQRSANTHTAHNRVSFYMVKGRSIRNHLLTKLYDYTGKVFLIKF